MTVITDFESGPGIWLVVAGAFDTIAQIPEQNRELAQTKEYLKRANHLASTGRTFERVNTAPVSTGS